jgi:hypothetical protein
MDLTFESSQQIINLLIPKASTIDDAKQLIKEKLNADTTEVIQLIISVLLRIGENHIRPGSI